MVTGEARDVDVWDVVVVGGGVAGLTAAATAADGGASVLLLDSGPPGGRASSDRVGRFLFNRGGHALYRRGAGRSVLDRLGVKVSGAVPPLRGARACVGDRVGLLPVGLGSLARTSLLTRGSKRVLARALVGLPRWRPEGLAERTAADWLRDLTDDRPDAYGILAVLARTTTYCVDFDRVSADLVASQVRSAVLHNVEYLHDGWASLVDGLLRAAERRRVRIDVGVRVSRVVPDGPTVRVELASTTRPQVLARRVVLAAGTPQANGSLLPRAPRTWQDLGPPARVACLDLGLASVPRPGVLLGVDRPLYLVRNGPPARGLAPEGAAMVPVMRYLRPDEDVTPEEARSELEAHSRRAGIHPEQVEEARYLHRMVACGAVPRAETGGMAGRPRVTDTGHEAVAVAGDWVGPTGHLADTALVSGEAAGRRVVEELERGPVAQPVAGRPVGSRAA